MEFKFIFGREEEDQDRKYALEAPRRRPMNDDNRDDFVAIDFETMTHRRTSACAIGMVKVIDAEIVKQYYSIINPVRDENTDKEPNLTIHGIDLATAEKADTFAEIFDEIRHFIGPWPIVCHNRNTDIAILNSLMEYYGLEGIDTSKVICTYELTGKSLSECCKQYGIKEDRHHNALWDAETCARIYLELIGKPVIFKGGTSVFGKDSAKLEKKKIDLSNRKRLDDAEIENKDSIFYNATIVITGDFEKFPNRNELAAKLQSLGARITSSVTRKTTHLLVGEGAGPRKLERVRELQDDGYEIVMLREHEFAHLIS